MSGDHCCGVGSCCLLVGGMMVAEDDVFDLFWLVAYWLD